MSNALPDVGYYSDDNLDGLLKCRAQPTQAIQSRGKTGKHDDTGIVKINCIDSKYFRRMSIYYRKNIYHP